MVDFDQIKQKLQAPVAAPLHLRLRQALQAQIANQTLQPGEALPPERVLQEQLGISRSTIRQALKSLEDMGLVKAAVGAGTFVLDSRTPTPDRDLVSIIIPDAHFYVYYADLASSLSVGLREAGYRVDMSIHNDRYETVAATVSNLLRQEAAAVVMVAPHGVPIDDMIHELRASGVPLLLLGRFYDHLSDVDFVGTDNERIGYEAAQHLIQLGHRGIVHLAGAGYSPATDRAAGYVRAMRENGLLPQLFVAPVYPRVELPPEFGEYQIETEAAELWMRVTRREITAAFCFNDMVASWVQKEVRNLNLIVPRDLSLIGVDNMPYDHFFDAPLTTFAQPGKEIGKQAAELLLRRLRGANFPWQRILLPAQFIQRLSTAPPRALPVRAGAA